MKRLVSVACIVFAMILAVSSCKKVTSNPYSGTYSGTLSSTVGDFNKENFKMIFTNGLVDETNLSLYGLPLTKITEEKYEAKGELVVKIIQLVTPSVTLEQIKDATFVFTFSEVKVSMSAQYGLLGIVDVSIMKYEGTKQ